VKLNVALIFVLIFLSSLAFGFLFYRINKVIEHKSPHEAILTAILITFGISLAMEDFISYVWSRGTGSPPYFTVPFMIQPICIDGLYISTSRSIALIYAAIGALFLHLFLKKSITGKSLRAIFQDGFGALVVGINIDRAHLKLFASSTIITGLSGIFFALVSPLEPASAIPLTLKALIIMAIGGVGNLIGAILGGFLLGNVETFASYFISPRVAQIFSFLVFLLVLLIRKRV
jgi:branched-chain amino acid transport system permease protein